jgi:hypothetical protein
LGYSPCNYRLTPHCNGPGPVTKSINTTPHPWSGVWVPILTWYQIRFRFSCQLQPPGLLPALQPPPPAPSRRPPTAAPSAALGSGDCPPSARPVAPSRAGAPRLRFSGHRPRSARPASARGPEQRSRRAAPRLRPPPAVRSGSDRASPPTPRLRCSLLRRSARRPPSAVRSNLEPRTEPLRDSGAPSAVRPTA